MGHPSLASEFPNDNASISAGAIWVCEQLTGRAKPVLGPFMPVPNPSFVLCFEDDDDYVEAPVELVVTSGGVTVAVADPQLSITSVLAEAPPPATAPELEQPAPSEAAAEPAEPAAFAQFEAALSGLLMSHGASRSAALLPRFLRLSPLPAEVLAKDVQLTLQSRGYLDGHARYTAKYRELCHAWCAILRGDSQDFGACGTTTLDRFGADLLSALLALPATRADELRRELRKAGIAAFGVLAAA